MNLRTTLLLFLLLWNAVLLKAQDAKKVISGHVTDVDNSPLPGITVGIAGTGYGTITKGDGSFTISVPANAKTLIFRAVGMQTISIDIANQSNMTVTMRPSASDLSEIIVSGAYGTMQSKRSTSFNAQVVAGEQINTIRQPDFSNALAGKVAGVQVRSQSAAKLGANAVILLRGISGFSNGGDNAPIYIVDGTVVTNINTINQDEIQDVSILQGPAAGAIYGSQGSNGAIVITLRKGSKGRGMGVTLNAGTQLDYVTNLPKYQNLYAGGSSDTLIQYRYKAGQPDAWKALDGKYYHDYADDASWGPKMTGQEYIPWYSWYEGSKYSFTTAKLNPQPNNAKEFFDVGVTSNNSISFTSSSDKVNFKLAYQNAYIKGMMPTQYQKRNNLNVATAYDLSEHFTVSANITYNNTLLNGEITDAYGTVSTGSFNQWFHRDLDMSILRELQHLKTPSGVYASWNHLNPTAYSTTNPNIFYQGNYWYNPYTYNNNVDYKRNTDRFFGNASITYHVNKDLKFTGTYRKQQSYEWQEYKRSSDLEHSGSQTGQLGSYIPYAENESRRNIELQGAYSKQIHDFSINALIGIDLYKYLFKSNYAATNGGLSIPNLYSLTNSVNTPTTTNTRFEEQYRAMFGNLNLGYDNFLFLNGTLRRDYYSTLPPDDNSVLSKSVGGSFVFTHFTADAIPWFNFGKVRASWGQVPKALGTVTERFGAYRYPGSLYNIFGNKYDGNLLMYSNIALVNPRIKGSTTSTFEAGLDLSFLKDRITVSGTYFNSKDKNFPYTVTINGASGYTSMLTNIGLIERSGLEFTLGLIPVNAKNFRWNFNANWSPLLKNDVVEISKEYNIKQTSIINSIWNASFPSLYHVAGKRWGRLIGGGCKLNDQGIPLVSDNGESYINNSTMDYGSVLPTHTGGVQNAFTIYKRFTVQVNIDWQAGGKFVSLSEVFGSGSGLTDRTADRNDKGVLKRDPVEKGGGVRIKGVKANGEAVDNYVDAFTYFHNELNNSIYNDYVYDLTFIKLREISIGYNIPLKSLRLDKAFSNANISLIARNLWLLYSKTNGDFDPSEIANVYGEIANLPGSRSFGFNLSLNF